MKAIFILLLMGSLTHASEILEGIAVFNRGYLNCEVENLSEDDIWVRYVDYRFECNGYTYTQSYRCSRNCNIASGRMNLFGGPDIRNCLLREPECDVSYQH